MIQTINPNEKFVFIENRVKALVKAIKTYCLILDIGYQLDFFQTLYIPFVSRNLVSLSKLDTTEYSFKFRNECFSLFKHNHFIGYGILCDGLFKLKSLLTFLFRVLILNHNVGTKRGLVDDSLTCLWHKCLGHMSKERILRVAKNEILHDLDFTDLGICVFVLKENT